MAVRGAAMAVNRLALAGAFLSAMVVGVALSLSMPSLSAAPQIKDFKPVGADGKPVKLGAGTDDILAEVLPNGVETRGEAEKRLAAYTPDPTKFPIPRTKWDGKPDLNGVYWPAAVVNGTRSPVALESLYRPEARDLREREDLVKWRNGWENPTFHCWPRSVLNASTGANGAIQVAQGPGIVVIMDEQDGRVRVVPIVNGPPVRHNPSHKPSYLGDSIGYWEGDTLVIDVTNFNGRPWLGSYDGNRPPQTSSEALHIVERWTRPDGKTLDMQPVIEDSKMLTGPYHAPKMRRGLMTYDMISESGCVENPDLAARETQAAEYRSEHGLPVNARQAEKLSGQGGAR